MSFASKLTFETHLHELVSRAAKSLGVVPRAGKLFYCPRVLKSCFSIGFAQPGALYPCVDIICGVSFAFAG